MVKHMMPDWKKTILIFQKSDFKADGLKKPEVITPVVMEEQEGIFPGAACWPAMNEKEPESSVAIRHRFMR